MQMTVLDTIERNRFMVHCVLMVDKYGVFSTSTLASSRIVSGGDEVIALLVVSASGAACLAALVDSSRSISRARSG